MMTFAELLAVVESVADDLRNLAGLTRDCEDAADLHSLAEQLEAAAAAANARDGE